MAHIPPRDRGKAPPLRRPRTPEALIEVAERLWAEQGMDAVSLREISAAAGLSNPAAVQYHFGDRYGLVRAIFTNRLPRLDTHRASLWQTVRDRLDRQDADASQTMLALLECLFYPLFTLVDTTGQRSYAGFLMQLLRDPAWTQVRGAAMDLTPVTAALIAAVRDLVPPMPDTLFNTRLIAVNAMILAVIHRVDREGLDAAAAQAQFEDALAMAAGALAVPLTASQHRRA